MRDGGVRAFFLAVALAAALAAGLCAAACGRAPVPAADDAAPIDVAAGPLQGGPESDAPILFTRGGYDWSLTPLASYALRGVVVGHKGYGGLLSDWRDVLAPYDVAVVWGDLARDGLYEKVSWSMSGRWYWWRYDGDFGHGNDFIVPRSSNSHVIPENENVERAVASLDEGEEVELRGLLVRADGKKGGFTCTWPSSLSRADKGDGSCEVFYVTRVRAGGKVFE